LAWVEDTAISAKIPSWSFLETILGKQELLLVFSNLAGAWTCESGVGWACEPRYAIFIPVCHTLTLIPAGADSTIIWSVAESSGISKLCEDALTSGGPPTKLPRTVLVAAEHLQKNRQSAHSHKPASILPLSYAIRVPLSCLQTRLEFAPPSCTSHSDVPAEACDDT